MVSRHAPAFANISCIRMIVALVNGGMGVSPMFSLPERETWARRPCYHRDLVMLKRGIIIAGAAVYVTVMAIVLSSGSKAVSPSPAAGGGLGLGAGASLEGLPFRSIGIQIQRVDWIPEYKKVMDKIADTGADTVLLVIDTRQENGKSSRIYLDYRMTPTVDQLGDLIDYAKKKELRVILMPIVLLDNAEGNDWRGTLHPDDWDKWWDSYRDMMQ